MRVCSIVVQQPPASEENLETIGPLSSRCAEVSRSRTVKPPRCISQHYPLKNALPPGSAGIFQACITAEITVWGAHRCRVTFAVR